MKILSSAAALEKTRTDLAVLLLTEAEARRRSGGRLAALNRKLKGLVVKLGRTEGFKGKVDDSLLVHTHDRIASPRLALVGLGSGEQDRETLIRNAVARAARLAQRSKVRRLTLELPAAWLEDATERPRLLSAAVEGALLAGYRFDRYRSRQRQDLNLRELRLLHPGGGRADADALERGRILAESVTSARDLVNEPARELTPVKLAQLAQDRGRTLGMSVKVWGPAQLERENMRLLLAVSAGSSEEPRVVRLAHRKGKRGAAPVVLVGKGITFDAGGLDIKTAVGMAAMKVDMAGAAAVLATMEAIARLDLPINVEGYLACAENMLGAAAYKPGDVIISRSGLSVEITNTDAEGRLALADTLSLAGEVEPRLMIDLATLTGACMVALGPHTAGLFSDDAALVKQLSQAGQRAGEDLWQLPLNRALADQIKSPIADLKNTGGRMGGAISAALFLDEFVPEGCPWAHIDIAGPATSDKENLHLSKGGTGFGVATLVRFLEQLPA